MCRTWPPLELAQLLVGVSIPDRGGLMQTAPSCLGCLARPLFKKRLQHDDIVRVRSSGRAHLGMWACMQVPWACDRGCPSAESQVPSGSVGCGGVHAYLHCAGHERRYVAHAYLMC